MKDGETFRKCAVCSNPTPNVWIHWCSECCQQMTYRERLRATNPKDVRIAELEAEVKLTRERLGPAGYKVLERVTELEGLLEKALNTLLDYSCQGCNQRDGFTGCHSYKSCKTYAEIQVAREGKRG